MQLKLFVPIKKLALWVAALLQPPRRKKEFVMSDEMKALLEGLEPGFAERAKLLRPPRFEDIAPGGAFPICDGHPRSIPLGENPYEDTFGF